MIVEICEMGMLIAFGCSWPFNIAKSLREKTTAGKSILFEVFIEIGYILGIIGKIWDGEFVSVPTPFYFVDAIMVAVDMMLYYRNWKLDQARSRCA